MEKYKRLLYILKTSILTLLFAAAVYFENAQQQRLMVLIGVFLAFLVSNLGKYFIKNRNNLYFFSFLLDTALIYVLEFNSRLLINYFFHSFYIAVLLESSLTLELKRGTVLGAVIVLVSMVKYAYLIYYKLNLANASQLLFFLMINVLILVIAAFAQHNREERQKKDILYRELLDAHRKLREYTDELRRLSVIEEKNKIARDIHDNLGHNMTALIMQLQMAQHYLDTDSQKCGKLMEDSLRTAKDSLFAIREVVETLRGKEKEVSAETAIKDLVQEFSRKTGAEISLDISGELPRDNGAGTALFHILQEGLTNSIRHGKASKIQAGLECSDNRVKFYIRDNGCGAENIREGYGMKGIRERVESFRGSVDFCGKDGFKIEGIIYVEGEDDKIAAGR
ncbi:MAG: sensor histidine kinase [Sedimentibacter sp.]|uniref:sensor histidine kinase n=1 Tax=Sedimentibacter sp. TaxID=1960295 RepID=UPI0031581C28